MWSCRKVESVIACLQAINVTWMHACARMASQTQQRHTLSQTKRHFEQEKCNTVYFCIEFQLA